jgi:hypothetical protein
MCCVHYLGEGDRLWALDGKLTGKYFLERRLGRPKRTQRKTDWFSKVSKFGLRNFTYTQSNIYIILSVNKSNGKAIPVRSPGGP